jgi:hypothetical protein
MRDVIDACCEDFFEVVGGLKGFVFGVGMGELSLKDTLMNCLTKACATSCDLFAHYGFSTSCNLLHTCYTMTYQVLFFNASVQADIQDWPTQIFASFVRIAEQMEVSGPNLGIALHQSHGVADCLKSARRGAEGIGRAFLLHERAKVSRSCMDSSRKPK